MRMCVLVSMIFFPKISFGINITKKKKPIDSSTLCVCQVDQFHDRKQKKKVPSDDDWMGKPRVRTDGKSVWRHKRW